MGVLWCTGGPQIGFLGFHVIRGIVVIGVWFIIREIGQLQIQIPLFLRKITISSHEKTVQKQHLSFTHYDLTFDLQTTWIIFIRKKIMGNIRKLFSKRKWKSIKMHQTCFETMCYIGEFILLAHFPNWDPLSISFDR